MKNRPLNKDNPRNIKCEHCKHFAVSGETRWAMICKCQNSKWHNEKRMYWNRCKGFEWHERYAHPTEKGGEK